MFYPVLFLMTLFSASASAVDCTDPAGVAGQMRYANPDMMVCDGNAWSITASSALGTTCSVAGRISLNSTDLQFCNGTNNFSMLGPQTNGTCSTTGVYRFNATSGWMEFCNGTNWKPMQNAPSESATGYVKTTEAVGTFTSNSLITPAFTGSVTTGNAIICMFYYDVTTTSITSVSDSAGNTYTKGTSLASNGQSVEMWYKENITGGSAVVVTATLGASVNSYKWRSCGEYSGIVKSNALDDKTAVRIITASATLGPLTTTAAKSVLWVGSALAGSTTPDASFTVRSTLDGNPTFDKRINIKGSYTASASGLSGANYFIYAVFRAQ